MALDRVRTDRPLVPKIDVEGVTQPMIEAGTHGLLMARLSALSATASKPLWNRWSPSRSKAWVMVR